MAKDRQKAARAVSRHQIGGGGDVKGKPDLLTKKAPWQGLAPMMSETLGPGPISILRQHGKSKGTFRYG